MKRNKFNLSYYRLATMDMGELVPVGCTEVLPGDTVQHATSALVRAAPMLAPVMHPIDVRIHHFYVPYRLIWSDFEKFITGGPDGNDATVWPHKVWAGAATQQGTLLDYLGLTLDGATAGSEASILPVRAYQLIWNEYYRDQDLETAAVISTGNGVDNTTSTTLQRCAWEKDLFTSSRPWEQKGPAITIPLGTSAPVSGIGVTSTGVGVLNKTNVRQTDPLTNATYGFSASTTAGTFGDLQFRMDGNPSGTQKPDIFADLTNASAITVTALREALALQRYEEARARFGSRYVEYLRYLGVRSSDGRLNRPEYLGGGRDTVQISEVLQTAPATSGSFVGTMRGHGLSAVRSNRYRRFFDEHGIVLTLMSARPKTMYMHANHKHWFRKTKEDYWQQELQHVGQQEVLKKEVTGYTAQAKKNDVFGFQDRYDEYRRNESTVHGEFKSSLGNFWHFARDFGSSGVDPVLNQSFVQCVPTERTFASSETDALYVMIKHNMVARRLVAPTGRSYIF